MGKLVVLKLGEGSFEQGFPVTLQIGEDGDRPSTEITGKLPPAPEIAQSYSRWATNYRHLGWQSRLSATADVETNVSHVSQIEICYNTAQLLSAHLNLWLHSDPFRSIRDKFLEQLLPSDAVRLIVQTKDIQLRRLPWHLWDLCDRYSKAEIALSIPDYGRVEYLAAINDKVRILAIIGNSAGINTQADRLLLEQLPDAEVSFLVEPQRRQELTEQLWSRQGWDILFFAGHSISETDGETGRIYINQTDSLTIEQLKYAVRKAVERGLKIAIFNSCDGLGLARDLADLQIPQIIVMREPVPDRVAQEFLKYFLEAFARGDTFYLAVREARERLQGLEDQFPCATWLPVICQNPAEVPPTWQGLRRPQSDKNHIDRVVAHTKQEPQSSSIDLRRELNSTANANLSRELQQQLERLLASTIGPIASIILKRTLAAASTTQDLVELLTVQLPEQERSQFQEQANVLLKDLPRQSPATATTPQTPITSASRAVDASFIKLCEQELAQAIGPIAQLFVQRTLLQQPEISRQQLVETLEQYLANPEEKIRFRQILLNLL